jgi:hypothetical protein
MKYPTSLQDQKYPEFIRNSMIIKAYPEPKKVFPYIGLKNQEISLSKIEIEPSSISIEDILQKVYDNTHTAYEAIGKFICKNPAHKSIDRCNELREDIGSILDSLANAIDSDYDRKRWLKKSKNTYSIIFNPQYHDGFHILPSSVVGQSLLSLLERVKTLLEPFKITLNIPDLVLCNTTADKLLDKKSLKLVFSSDGPQGMWDIATMSQGRGIMSCMNWSSDRATSLLGSMVDPFAGIIYITDGSKTKNGYKMLYRSVVRLTEGDKKTILIERIYKGAKVSGDLRKVQQIFIAFIRQITKGKIEVCCCSDEMDDEAYDLVRSLNIPLSEPVKQIMDLYDDGSDYGYCDSQYISYRDSEVTYADMYGYDKIEKIKL